MSQSTVKSADYTLTDAEINNSLAFLEQLQRLETVAQAQEAKRSETYAPRFTMDDWNNLNI